jgi:hypothetical protein
MHRGKPPPRPIEPPGASLRAKGTCKRERNAPSLRAHLRCKSQPGASAQPLYKPPGGSLRANATVNAAPAALPARTFGAKHSRGLPPNRFISRLAAACGQTRLSTRQQRPCLRAPSVRNTAGGFRPTALPAAWRQPAGKRDCQRGSSGLACAHLRCETQPGASAQPLMSRKHSGPCCG